MSTGNGPLPQDNTIHDFTKKNNASAASPLTVARMGKTGRKVIHIPSHPYYKRSLVSPSVRLSHSSVIRYGKNKSEKANETEINIKEITAYSKLYQVKFSLLIK